MDTDTTATINQASKSPEIASVASGDECDDSLLAFVMDSSGRPYVQADFKSLRDKLALLCLAESFLADLKLQALNEVVRPSPVKLAA